MFPWLPSDTGESGAWARIAIPMAGAERGTYFLPEVDDQVLVVFEHGSIERPIIIGCMWNESQMPPVDNAEGENNFRMIQSRSGHRVVLDDTDGAERITISHSAGKELVVMDSAEKSVTLYSKDGEIEIKSESGATRLHGKAVCLTTTDKYTAKGTSEIAVLSPAMLDVNASSDLEGKASMLQVEFGPPVQPIVPNIPMIDPQAGAKAKASSSSSGGSAGSGGAAGAGAAGAADAAASEEALQATDSTAFETVPPSTEALEESEELHEIEIALVDDNGDPVAYEPVRVTLPDGSTKEGKTNSSGKFAVYGIKQAGECQVSFYELDKDAWDVANDGAP